MIGRAAQGRPWIFREIAHFLATGEHLAAPEVLQAKRWLLEHLTITTACTANSPACAPRASTSAGRARAARRRSFRAT
jgi:tRNA-dihydrouridine synthase